MKRTRLLHAELSALIARMGHGDILVIGDAGLPVPPGVACVDLAVTPGLPELFPVLDVILSELQVERAVLAHETSAPLSARFTTHLPEGLEIGRMSHAEFKALSATARAVVRTGETTPYCNVALVSGVVF